MQIPEAHRKANTCLESSVPAYSHIFPIDHDQNCRAGEYIRSYQDESKIKSDEVRDPRGAQSQVDRSLAETCHDDFSSEYEILLDLVSEEERL